MVSNKLIKHTLTVSLQGGLGNQLFQYAFGRAWSLRNNLQVIFDDYGFQFDRVFKRSLLLKNFSIPNGIEINSSRYLFQLARFLKHFGKIGVWLGKRHQPYILIEKNAQFESKLIQTSILGSSYAFGYWQDEQYFIEYAKTIRKDLCLLKPFSITNELLKQEILSTPHSVAIHIRRLHQVSANQEEQSPHKNGEEDGIILSANYYHRAMAYLEKQVPKANYFIFSDYKIWAKKNLIFKNQVKYLQHDESTDYEDLILMSLCKHHIIANSSFSWWGAWLGESEGQIVIAPKAIKLTPKIPKKWVTI
jgi:hypothetical protein